MRSALLDKLRTEKLDESDALLKTIRSHIDEKLPLAMIRCSDGEAIFNLQDFKNGRFFEETHFRACMRVVGQTLEDMSMEMLADLQDRHIKGIRDADIVCVELHWIRKLNLNGEPKDAVDRFVDMFLDADTQKICSMDSGLNMFSSRGQPYFRNLPQLLKPGDDLVLITCRPQAATTIFAWTGVMARDVIEIPSENTMRGKFPGEVNAEGSIINDDGFCERTAIDKIKRVVRPGTVVIMGASVLKPMFCSAVKAAGGVALDAGSVLDRLVGFTTRGSQKGTFEHVLGPDGKMIRFNSVEETVSLEKQ